MAFSFASPPSARKNRTRSVAATPSYQRLETESCLFSPIQLTPIVTRSKAAASNQAVQMNTLEAVKTSTLNKSVSGSRIKPPQSRVKYVARAALATIDANKPLDLPQESRKRVCLLTAYEFF